MRKKRLSLLLAPLVALGLTWPAAACGGGGSGAGGDEYVIGAALPLSGPAASFGMAYRKGIDGCVELVNESKDLPHPVTVKYVDTGAETAKGIAGFTQLATVDHATAVFSAYSSVTTALIPLAERHRVPLINGGALSPTLANKEWVWNTLPFLSTELGASLPYAKEQMPDAKKAMLVYQDDIVGKGAVDVVRKAWRGNGRTLATLPLTLSATSFSAQVDKIKAFDPDVIFMVFSGDPQAVLVRQLRSAGVTTQIIASSSFPVPAVLDLKEANGSLFTLQAMDFASQDPMTKGFLRTTGLKPGEGVIVGAANYCNGVLMWANAAKQLVTEGKEVDGPNLNEKFARQGSIDAVGGKLQLLPDHTLQAPISIYKIKDGAFTPVTTVEVTG
ncbi:ABC transporter substrate-binding protein [Thermocrispum sp.]|nr:ABC transporter substrate-binding protein [Thermocrispum sp.]